MRNFINSTVFHRMRAEWVPDKVLAILFHRAATTLYLIYFVWGICSAIDAVPSLKLGKNDPVETLFSLLVSIASGLSFYGALRFPKTARLEMFSSGSLVTLIFVYGIFSAIGMGHGSGRSPTSLILFASYFVVPICRMIFIYLTLIKQADILKRDGGRNG